MICPYCEGTGRIDPRTAGLGGLVKAARKARGLTQAELAERIGCTRVWVCYVETGRNMPMLKDLKKWARALEVGAEELLPG